MIINRATVFLKKHGTIKKIEDGVLFVNLNNDPGNINQMALDNVIRYCTQEHDRDKWKAIIDEHFANLTNPVKVDKSDYAKCREFLSVRIYPEYEDDVKKVLVHKVDFPGTMSALVLDLTDKYESINMETINSWGVPVDSLFRMAQENVNNKDEMEISERKENGPGKVYAFFSADYSANYIRDIEQNAGFAIGKFGAFVAIPTTGACFAIPINDKAAIEALEKLRPNIQTLFDEDPGNITTNIYWYHKGRFELVRVVKGDVVIPKELKSDIS